MSLLVSKVGLIASNAAWVSRASVVRKSSRRATAASVPRVTEKFWPIFAACSASSRDRLTEMFSKLIGVKQGRLTWPFDSKPSDAKRFFEPLLDVEVFRQCYDRLRPVVASFEREQGEYQRKESAVSERIRDRADSQEKLPAARKAIDDLTAVTSDANKAREAALQEKLKHDQFARAATEAKAAWELSSLSARTAKERRREAENRVSEAETAAGTVAEFQPRHAAYESADKALKELDTRRRTRDALQKRRSFAETDRKTNEGRATAAREQQALLVGQQAQKVAQHKALADTIAVLQTELDSTKDGFARAQQAAKVATDDLGLVNAWVQSLPRLITRLGSAAATVARLTRSYPRGIPLESPPLDRPRRVPARLRPQRRNRSRRHANAKRRSLNNCDRSAAASARFSRKPAANSTPPRFRRI